MSCKIFCKSISYDSTDATLTEHFKTYGEVVADGTKVVTDKDTGKSKGFGFVQFSCHEEAKKAVDAGKHTVDGRTFEPILAKEFKIFVGGIQEDFEQDDLKSVFEEFGKVTSVDLPKDKATGKNKGFAFVGYDDKKESFAAIKKGAHQIKGKTCKVREAVDKEQMNQMKQYQQQQQMYGGYGAGYGGGYGGGYGHYGGGDAYGAYGGGSQYGYGFGDYSAQGYGGGPMMPRGGRGGARGGRGRGRGRPY